MTSALTGGKRFKPNLKAAEAAGRGRGVRPKANNCAISLYWASLEVIYDSSLNSKQDDLAIDLETLLTFLARGNQLIIILVNDIDSMYILI